MAASWKGYRRIVVGDRVFYWIMGEYDQSITVRLEESPNSVLTLLLQGQPVALTPRLVSEGIERALTLGWLSEQPVMAMSHATVKGK